MEVHTPSAQVMPKVVQQTANKATCLTRKPSVAKSAGNKSCKQPSSGGNCTEVKHTRQAINRSISLKKENCAEKSAAQENQTVKRQKLEAGRLQKILTIKEHILPHKTHPKMAANKDSTVSIYKNNERKWNSAYKCRTSEQLHQQSLTHHDGTGAPSQKHKPLILTIPKDPRLETAQRSRPTRFKSADELEEEMLAKIPKFKARPLNKKILEAPLLPPLQKTVPQLPEFQTMERSLQHSSTSSSTDSAVIPDKRPCESVTGVVLTEPRPAHLETALRARPPKVKSSEELEQEELQKIPKFKARPLNKKVPVNKIPAKPIPKECTKPEPFQLESLTRHEEELEQRTEELARVEREEQEMRTFRAQPIISNVPVHVPEMPRKPLTEVQEFTFHADARALERAKFDQKVKEKENLYKRFRDDYETAKKLRKERSIKKMRKMMVPHA